MGVKGLWTILAPVGEKKPLWELKDQTVAIDLSGWICENQSVDNFSANLYLRNLFFRTSFLLLIGIKPIFILEGEAPSLKHDVIDKRRKILKDALFDSVSERDKKVQRRGNRSRLNSMQKQCEEFLKCIGVPCYYSQGEAEALCAFLNEQNVVQGVISQDSDCFLYGAKTVCKNFTIGSSGGNVEIYDSVSIERKLGLGRNKLIALSLLCGCDYNTDGVLGIGKETALKYLSLCTDSEVLERLRSWRNFPLSDDTKSNTTTKSKLEISLMRKALKNASFPFTEVQNEFLKNQTDISHISYEWRQPNLKTFVLLAERCLGWTADYSLEKFIPLASRWHLLHNNSLDCGLQFERIVKKRNLRNVPSYEVKWKDFDIVTTEPSCILKSKYHDAVQHFELTRFQRIAKPGKNAKTTKDQLNDNKKEKGLIHETKLAEITNELDRLCVQQPADDSLTVSDFECSAADLLELSSIVESITNNATTDI